MNNEQLNSSSCIRTHLGPRIFSFPPESFTKPEWRYENCHTLAGWTESPDGQAFYSPFAPILYNNYQGRPDINTIFLNQALFDVSKFLCSLKL
jgi:hypothetical protein